MQPTRLTPFYQEIIISIFIKFHSLVSLSEWLLWWNWWLVVLSSFWSVLQLSVHKVTVLILVKQQNHCKTYSAKETKGLPDTVNSPMPKPIAYTKKYYDKNQQYVNKMYTYPGRPSTRPSVFVDWTTNLSSIYSD